MVRIRDIFGKGMKKINNVISVFVIENCEVVGINDNEGENFGCRKRC